MGEVPFQSVGLRPTEEAMAAGNPVGGPFQVNPTEEQDPAGDLVLFLGDLASFDVERRPGRSLPHSMSSHHRFHLRFYRRRQHLHVRVRRRQILLPLPVRHAPIRAVHLWGSFDDPLQHNHRERSRHMGSFRQKAQVLRC